MTFDGAFIRSIKAPIFFYTQRSSMLLISFLSAEETKEKKEKTAMITCATIDVVYWCTWLRVGHAIFNALAKQSNHSGHV